MSANHLLPARRDVALVGGSAHVPDWKAGGRLLWVVLAVLSRIIGHSRSDGVTDISHLNRFLHCYALVQEHGSLGADGQRGRGTDATSGLKRLGRTRQSLVAEWEQARFGDDPEGATLDGHVIAALVPPYLWPVIAEIVTAGPTLTARRAEQVVYQMSKLPAPVTCARPAPALLALATLRTRMASARQLMTVLAELRSWGAFLPELDAWTHVPQIRMPTAAEAHTDRSSPPLSVVRRGLGYLNEQIWERLRVDCLEDELEAAATAGRQRVDCGVWPLVRVRASLVLLLVTGARNGALRRLTIGDYHRQRLCVDGAVRPCLALRPGKTIPLHEIRWRPLVREAARMVDVALIVYSRASRRTPRSRDLITDPALALDPTMALLPGSFTRPDQAFCPRALRNVFTGRRTEAASNQRTPLLPKPNSTPEAPAGYTTHTLRGTVLQEIRAHGPAYCSERGITVNPADIAEIMLDHDLRSDAYGYADLATPRGREKWCAVGGDLMWELLAGDRGARKAPDAVRFEALLREELTLQDELEHIEGTFDQIVGTARGAETVESATLLELLAVTERRDRVRSRLTEVTTAAVRLRTDPDARVTISDHEDLPEELTAVQERVLGKRESTRPKRPPVRDWLPVTQFAEVGLVSTATARRWVAGHNLPRSPGDPRRPWEPDAIPVDRTLGARRVRIWMPGVSPAFLRGQLQQARLAELLSEWPEGWSADACNTPLTLDDDVLRRLQDRGLGDGSDV